MYTSIHTRITYGQTEIGERSANGDVLRRYFGSTTVLVIALSFFPH